MESGWLGGGGKEREWRFWGQEGKTKVPSWLIVPVKP